MFFRYGLIIRLLSRHHILVITFSHWMKFHVTVAHRMKSVRIRSFSGRYFPAFGLNTKKYSVPLRFQSECGKVRTRKTPYTYKAFIEKMWPDI